MQWLREILQAKGIEVTDELIADVQKELPKYLIPKTEFNNKIAEIDNLRDQLGQKDTTIGTLQAKADTVDSLTQQLSTLQTKYDTDTGDLNKKLSKVQFDSALDVALAGSGAKNAKALRALLDMEKITFADGKLSGFDEQLDSIKAENDNNNTAKDAPEGTPFIILFDIVNRRIFFLEYIFQYFFCVFCEIFYFRLFYFISAISTDHTAEVLDVYVTGKNGTVFIFFGDQMQKLIRTAVENIVAYVKILCGICITPSFDKSGSVKVVALLPPTVAG